MMKRLPAVLGIVAAVGLSTPTIAETQMEKALSDGAVRLTADEIAERLAGKTATFEVAANGKRFHFYYDGRNGTAFKPVGGDTVMEGFYAVSAGDRVCIGTKGNDPIRLRCLNVLLIDGKMHKFNLDGSLRGHVVEQQDGKLM